jgi:alpha-1,2-mannosyltransferase
VSRRVLLLLLFLVELGFGAVPLTAGRDTDFMAYFQAAGALSKGVDPYLDTAHPYLYPPLLAVALLPFHALPAELAVWLWMSASAGLLAFAAARLSRGMQNEGRGVILLALLFSPFAATQWNAQANAFLLVALVLSRERLDSGEDLAGGAALGLAIALKPLAFFAVAGLLLTGRLRAALVSAGTFAASFLLVVPFLGWKGLALCARHVYEILFASWPVPYEANISLNGSLDRLFPVGDPGVRHRIAAAAVLGLAALVTFLAARRAKAAPSRVIDLFLAATLLAADSSWLHQSTVLFPLASGASPPAAAASVLLYAAAASWRFARDAAGAGAASVAALAGTAAIAVLGASAFRRLRR